MNKVSVGQIKRIIEGLEQLSFEIEQLKNQEEECKDNIPEHLQESERFLVSDHACDSMETALEYLDSVTDALNEAIDF